MNRRHFLSAALLGGAAATAAHSARAMEVVDCESAPGSNACRKLTEHQEILQRLDAMLAEKGMDAEQRKIALAAATCPFCGQPLVTIAANGGGGF